ncbi:MAG TPA: hypothetical protein VFK06_26290 [Candidatus Angelobacter sp.]|nr:hypothetical protein [Candidatus Angelobacter sp.]
MLLISFLLIVSAAWLWFTYFPTHWLTRVDFGIVKIDEHRVDAEISFGNPAGEAEAIALVHLKDGRDFFLNFGTEKVRRGTSSEYLRLFNGAWCIHSMQKGLFRAPLPFRNLNEFRIATEDGQVVTIQL